MSTIKVNNIQPNTGTAVTVTAGNDLAVPTKVVTPTVQGSTSVNVNAANGNINLQLNSVDKLKVLASPTGSDKTVTVVGDLYVSGGIYGNGANVTGVIAAGTGGTTSSGNLTIQYGTGGSGAAIFSANTTEVARMFYNGNFTVDNGVLFVDAVNNRIGVNTTAPTVPLHVSGDGRVTQNLTVGNQLVGGIGAANVDGTLDWNHSSNARSGSGYSLLRGNASNGPGNANGYYHPFSLEYQNKDGTGNMTQFAVPYIVDQYATNALAMRSKYNGAWSSWVGFVAQPIGGAGITVNSTGLVGINNNSPASRLDVVGNAQVTGRLTLAGSTAGVAFPASFTDTASANVLDDYEEGTFSPTISYQGSSGVTTTYSTQLGNYTKIGNRVFFNIYVVFRPSSNSVTSAATMTVRIAGLPFAQRTGYYAAVHLGFRNTSGWSATAASRPHGAYMNPEEAAILLIKQDLASLIALADTQVSQDNAVMVSGHYITHTA
jgi:hypothetical protein